MQSDLPTPVSPFLDPASAPEPSLHLLGGIWIASCPTCGYQLATARTQQRVERRARFYTCPICRGDDAA
jgi:predicted RNA-binding Zn-ribbon protein involved in translation (DUF1610 family)